MNWFMRVIADSTRHRVVLLNLRQLDKAERGKLTKLRVWGIELGSWTANSSPEVILLAKSLRISS